MSGPRDDHASGGRRDWRAPVLLVWTGLTIFALIRIGGGLLDTFYFEWDRVTQQRVEAAVPWLAISVAAMLPLGAIAFVFGARWWQALLVASPFLMMIEYPFVHRSSGTLLLMYGVTFATCALGVALVVRQYLRSVSPRRP